MTGAGVTRVPEKAMVLAAGLGERMRPLTLKLPKPLVRVRGQALLDIILDRLAAAGVKEIVINLHYLGSMIEEHLRGRETPRIVFSHEAERLETGGGVRKALPLFGAQPFFALNGDVLWLDGRTPALHRLAAAWDERRMDALLLLHPTAFAIGYDGRGDFMLSPEGHLRRRAEREVAPFVFAGLQILHPRLFEGVPEGRFSLNMLYDRAEAAGRLWGVRHDGEWFHIGTPANLEEVEDALSHVAVLSAQS